MEHILSVVIAVVSGVAVYIIGELMRLYFLEPQNKYKELKSRIAYALSYYGNLYTNVINLADGQQKQSDEYRYAADEMRKLACELRAFAELRYWYNLGISNIKTINDASAKLFALSNSFFCPNNTHLFHEQSVRNHDVAQEIRKLLKLKGATLGKEDADSKTL